MSLMKRKKQPQLMVLSNDEAKLYQLELEGGMIIHVRASHVSHTETMYLFMNRQVLECFMEIPKAVVVELKLVEEDGGQEEVVRTGYTSRLNKYEVKFANGHVCMIIASSDEWDGADARFYCHQTPFVTIHDAGDCQFSFCSW